MREIKFRIWDKEYEEFSNWTNRDPFFDVTSGKIFFWERVKREDGTYAPDVVLEEVGDRFILQQFTGLKDRNGKDIYEGDFIQYNQQSSYDGINFETIWSDAALGWIFKSKSGDCLVNEKTPNGYRYEFIEVIGNIFENKELLK